MKLGSYQLDSVETGEFRLDGGAMFGVVPKPLWERTNPGDEKNRIRLALRSLLIRGNGKVILVDTGIGEKWGPKACEMYAIDHSRYQMDRSLAKLGVERSEITDVVITHLHFDHVGGATRYTSGGSVELSFPNAQYYIHADNLTHAHAPSEKDRASFIEETIGPLQQSGRLVTIPDKHEFAPGVTAWVTHGHTPGQTLLKVTDGSRTLLFCGDTIPTASHIPLPYVMAYDLYPLTTLSEKKVILEQAVAQDWILMWVHDPLVAACTVRLENGKYRRGEDIAL